MNLRRREVQVSERTREKTRVAFVINSLEGGGAERAFCKVLDGICKLEPSIEAHLVLLDTTADAYFPETDVRVHRLNAKGRFWKSVSLLKAALQQIRPQVTLSFLSRANCACVLTARQVGHRALISERVSPSSHLGSGLRGAFLRAVTRLIYSRADLIIAVSQGVKFDLIENLKAPSDRVEVIYNPIDAENIRFLSQLPPACRLPDHYIVSMGRLTRNKNFDLLVRSFARSSTTLDLVILGDGAERQSLQRLAEELGVRERIWFVGYQSNPFSILRGAEFFVSASNAEGFPNALIEALALGLPAAFTNCRYGPAEILTDDPFVQPDKLYVGEFGILTPTNDIEALTCALDFLSIEENATPLRAKALRRAEAYEPESSYRRYLQCLLSPMKPQTEPPH